MHHGDDGDEKLVCHGRDPQHMLAEGRHGLVAVGGNGHADGAAGVDLLDVRHGLVVHAVCRDDGHHGEARLKKGDGPVLYLAGGIGLGVQVADLLELEGTLVGGGGVDAAAQEEG